MVEVVHNLLILQEEMALIQLWPQIYFTCEMDDSMRNQLGIQGKIKPSCRPGKL